MQKPKNLLPGLFLCVFSRTAEPLVDFIAVIFGFSFFYLGQTFFAGKKGVSGPFYIGPFYTGPFCTPIPQKTPRTPHIYKHAALFGMPPRPHERAQRKKPREPVAPLNAHLKIPTQKASRTRRAFTSTPLYLACRRAPRKAPASARPQPLKNYPFGALYRKPCLVYAHKRPHAKNPGSKSRGLVDEKFI